MMWLAQSTGSLLKTRSRSVPGPNEAPVGMESRPVDRRLGGA